MQIILDHEIEGRDKQRDEVWVVPRLCGEAILSASLQLLEKTTNLYLMVNSVRVGFAAIPTTPDYLQPYAVITFEFPGQEPYESKQYIPGAMWQAEPSVAAEFITTLNRVIRDETTRQVESTIARSN